MPQPIGRDLAETAERLQGWLGKRLPEAESIRIEDLRGPKDTGFSSDTLMFTMHSEQAGRAETRELVIRLEPGGDCMIFPEYDVALQYRMMEALADTAVPVPEMLWLEEDLAPLGSPFYVMEMLEGQVPNDSPPYHAAGWLCDLEPEQRAQLWFSGLDAMAEVHKLDWQQPAFDVIPRPPDGLTPMQAQIRYWDHYLNWGLDRDRYPLLNETLAWLDAHRPASEPTGICWGDSRISNLIFRDCETVAVIDWEMVFIGNPVADLAWFITIDRCFTDGLGLPRLEGMPDRAATVARWEEKTGVRAEHFDYYEVFAAFRFSAIMARVMLQMKFYELVPQEATADVDNLASIVLETLMKEVR